MDGSMESGGFWGKMKRKGSEGTSSLLPSKIGKRNVKRNMGDKRRRSAKLKRIKVWAFLLNKFKSLLICSH
jgi:hypothetical protein